MSPPIRVLVVDDDALVRAGLSLMLAGAPDVSVVAEVADGTEVVGAVNEHRPDVVLMDIRMPRMDGLAATELLRSRRNPPEIIILTTFDSDDHVLRAPADSCSSTPRRRTSHGRSAWSPRANRRCHPR
ncbi:MAG TPA: response regulator transcription factor [Actinomadura sp.]|nr:response regulator transcription factor [Actinomadura sp.]